MWSTKPSFTFTRCTGCCLALTRFIDFAPVGRYMRTNVWCQRRKVSAVPHLDRRESLSHFHRSIGYEGRCRVVSSHHPVPPPSRRQRQEARCRATHRPVKYQYAQPFWQHTGLGISGRYAEHCLSLRERRAETTTRCSRGRMLRPRHFSGRSRFCKTYATLQDCRHIAA